MYICIYICWLWTVCSRYQDGFAKDLTCEAPTIHTDLKSLPSIENITLINIYLVQITISKQRQVHKSKHIIALRDYNRRK